MAKIGNDRMIVRAECRDDHSWLFLVCYTACFDESELGGRFDDRVLVRPVHSVDQSGFCYESPVAFTACSRGCSARSASSSVGISTTSTPGSTRCARGFGCTAPIPTRSTTRSAPRRWCRSTVPAITHPRDAGCPRARCAAEHQPTRRVANLRESLTARIRRARSVRNPMIPSGFIDLGNHKGDRPPTSIRASPSASDSSLGPAPTAGAA